MGLRNFCFLSVAVLLEPFLRLISVGSEFVRADCRYGVERKIRGYVYSHYFRCKNLQIDRNVQLEGISNIDIGNNVSIYSGTVLVAGRRERVEIGDNTHVGRMSILSGLGSAVVIGTNCHISSYVAIYSVTNNKQGQIQHSKVHIGDDVLIGSGVTIQPGVSIGRMAAIGSGAVVILDVGERETVGGIPARPLKTR